MIYIYNEMGELSNLLLKYSKKESIKLNFKIRFFLKINKKINKIFKKESRVKIVFKKILIKLYIKKLKIDDNVKNTFVFFDFSPLCGETLFLSLLKETHPNIKLKFWYWNSLLYWEKKCETRERYLEVKKTREKIYDEIVTYHHEDAIKNNYRYINQFYSDEIAENISKSKNRENDLYFCGRDKNRIDLILKVKEKINELGKSFKFSILKDEKKDYSPYEKKENSDNFLLEKGIKYKDMLEEIKNSKVLLDIVEKGEVGVTLRVVESLFFEKKLISNNKLIKNLEFYNRKNIFIIEDFDNIEIEKKFFETEYEKVDENIKKKYDLENWLNEISK